MDKEEGFECHGGVLCSVKAVYKGFNAGITGVVSAGHAAEGEYGVDVVAGGR